MPADRTIAPHETAAGDAVGRADGASEVVRRAPFSNTRIAARGQRTQQRIVDAALRVFGDEGYHRGSIDRIAKLGGCSRVSFYQYFANKEDVFRHLAAQVARQLVASTEALDPLTADGDGWTAMRAWVARYAEIYARYQPVFNAYQTAVESDEALASAGTRIGDQNVARIQSRVAATTLLSPPQLEPVIRMLLECLTHTLDVTGILRSAAPDAYPSERVVDAVTDVLHRTLFGRHNDVNVHSSTAPPLPTLEIAPAMLDLLRQDDPALSSAAAKGALAALLASGRDVFVRRGYHSTRVDDLIAAAGVSRGAFYRYFKDKGELARVLTARAVRGIGATVLEMPDVFALDESAGRRALRRWLRRYNDAHVAEAAMLRVWVDGALQDPTLRAESAPPLDWGRRRMSRSLRRRDFGDVDMDAVVMVALLGVFGARQRPATEVEAAVHIIERGLLGL